SWLILKKRLAFRRFLSLLTCPHCLILKSLRNWPSRSLDISSRPNKPDNGSATRVSVYSKYEGRTWLQAFPSNRQSGQKFSNSDGRSEFIALPRATCQAVAFRWRAPYLPLATACEANSR